MGKLAKEKEVGVTHVELEIPIRASRERVWNAIVEEINLWWRKDFYSSEKTKRFVLEPTLGGKMYEDLGKGAGFVWYTVAGLDPGHKINLVGYLTPAFGGPATSILELSLEEKGKTTVLHLSDATLGPAANSQEKTSGWKMLFEDGLRDYVEANN